MILGINSPMKYYSPAIDQYSRDDILADLDKWRNGFTKNSNMAVELIKLSQISPVAFGIFIARQWAYYEFRLIRYAMRPENIHQVATIFRLIHRVTTDNPILLEIDEPDLSRGASVGYRTFERRSKHYLKKWQQGVTKIKSYDYHDLIRLIDTNQGAFCEWYRSTIWRYLQGVDIDIKQLRFFGIWFDRNAKKHGKHYTVDEVHRSVDAYWHGIFNGISSPVVNFEEKFRL